MRSIPIVAVPQDEEHSYSSCTSGRGAVMIQKSHSQSTSNDEEQLWHMDLIVVVPQKDEEQFHSSETTDNEEQ